jgi:hypothetical protein
MQWLVPSWGVSWTTLPEHNWLAFTGACLWTGVFYLAAIFALRVISAEDLRVIRDLRRANEL